MTEKEEVAIIDNEEPVAVQASLLDGRSPESGEKKPPTPDVNANAAKLPLNGGVPNDHAVSIGQVNPAFADNSNAERVSGVTPVYYSSHGDSQIAHEHVVVRRSDGSRVIVTPERPVQPTKKRIPVKEKDLRFLKIFSGVAVIMFLPLGLAAVYCCYMTHKIFYTSIENGGGPAKAIRFSKRCQNLCIFSIVSGLVTLALVFAILEHFIWEHDDDYWEKRVAGIGVTG